MEQILNNLFVAIGAMFAIAAGLAGASTLLFWCAKMFVDAIGGAHAVFDYWRNKKAYEAWKASCKDAALKRLDGGE